MLKTEFWRTPDFSYKEMENTGSDVAGVKLLTMMMLQNVRTDLGQTIDLCENGLNSGDHLSEYHDGRAVDWSFRHYIDPMVVVLAMIRAGYNGIGVYKNVGGYYSYHGDTREIFGSWYREYKDDGTHTEENLFISKMWVGK